MSEIYQNRKLIWKLAKNDFKKRYAGSALGAVWALIQPVVTVGMYWLVFDVIAGNPLRAGNSDIPYVLFLTAGLVPWFYFSEALPHGTAALLEYSYLVKKVVFKIDILPVVKIIAATFIHAFFALLALLVAALYGVYPGLHTIQLVYYGAALCMLSLGLSYLTSAIVVFFRDLQQMIAIALQIGMWATPILWDINMLSAKVRIVFCLNPLTYIVEGYRDAVYGGGWFFARPLWTGYFWGVTLSLFWLGRAVFKKLKVHFADVL